MHILKRTVHDISAQSAFHANNSPCPKQYKAHEQVAAFLLRFADATLAFEDCDALRLPGGRGLGRLGSATVTSNGEPWSELPWRKRQQLGEPDKHAVFGIRARTNEVHLPRARTS